MADGGAGGQWHLFSVASGNSWLVLAHAMERSGVVLSILSSRASDAAEGNFKYAKISVFRCSAYTAVFNPNKLSKNLLIIYIKNHTTI